MFDVEQFREVIVEPTLRRMAHWGYTGADNPAAVNLLVGTAWHESKGGTYLKQVNGPALGIYQIEVPTHEDVWKNYISHSSRLAHVYDMLPYEAQPDTSTWLGNPEWHRQLIVNLEYATVIARLLYYRHNFVWCDPDDIEGLGQIWKEFYNTVLGAGTIEKFVNDYPDA